MSRKFFRRFKTSLERVRTNRHLARLGPRLQHPNLWHLNRRSVAGGVAAGLFAGLVPGSNPVQFLVGALLAIGFRINLPIAVLVTLYSTPFTVVPLYYFAFKLGQLALLEQGAAVPQVDLSLQGRSVWSWLPDLWQWLASVGKPLLVGVPLLGIVLAIFGYFIVDMIWRCQVGHEWRKRKARRLDAGRAS
jgi:uncharacterized protein